MRNHKETDVKDTVLLTPTLNPPPPPTCKSCKKPHYQYDLNLQPWWFSLIKKAGQAG